MFLDMKFPLRNLLLLPLICIPMFASLANASYYKLHWMDLLIPIVITPIFIVFWRASDKTYPSLSRSIKFGLLIGLVVGFSCLAFELSDWLTKYVFITKPSYWSRQPILKRLLMPVDWYWQEIVWHLAYAILLAILIPRIRALTANWKAVQCVSGSSGWARLIRADHNES